MNAGVAPGPVPRTHQVRGGPTRLKEPTMPTRAKFRCNSVEQFTADLRTYKFSAVIDNLTAENERYHRYTPSGMLQISVDNPAVSFDLGRSYYLDFTPADEPV